MSSKKDKNDGWEVVTKKSNYVKSNDKPVHEEEKTEKKPLFKTPPGERSKNSLNSGSEKKYNAGHNKQRQTNYLNDRKLLDDDDDTQSYGLATVPKEMGVRIQQLRMVRNLSQADLAKAINEKPTVINAVENGTAIMNTTLIMKIEKALGKKVRETKK